MAERMAEFKQSTRFGSGTYDGKYSSKLWPLVSFVVVVVLACVCVCAVACCLCLFQVILDLKPNLRKGNYVILDYLVRLGRTRPY